MLLKESKQVGTLYHCTSFENFLEILKENKLGKNKVSFSRDKNYNYILGSWNKSQIQIVVDGDKLSTLYKIKPVDEGYSSKRGAESEEIVEKPIKNIGKFIIAFNPLVDNVSSLYKPEEKQIIFTFLKKYPHIKNNILPEEKNYLQLEKELSGFYKNGKRIKPFTYETYPDISFDFLKLNKVYKNDWLIGNYLISADPIDYPDSTELQGYDIIFVRPEDIVIRTQNPSEYGFLEAFGPTEIVEYKSYTEKESENG